MPERPEPSPNGPVIGVDGGGTTCRLALVHDGRRTEHQAPGTNVSTDFPGAIQTLNTALDMLARKAGIAPADLCAIPAYLGLAGVTSPDLAARVAAALPLSRARVEEDRPAAFVGALGLGDGAVAGLGTGSFLGRQSAGQRRFIGGYGLILGDEASAAWLGRTLLSRVLQAADGLCAHSPLTRATLADKGGAAGIIAFAAEASPADFGALAPGISAAAGAAESDPDPVATELMHLGAGYIAHGLTALGWRSTEPLCLMGGASGAYRAFLPEPMARAVTAPRGTALDGALALAAATSSGARP